MVRSWTVKVGEAYYEVQLGDGAISVSTDGAEVFKADASGMRCASALGNKKECDGRAKGRADRKAKRRSKKAEPKPSEADPASVGSVLQDTE